MVQLDGVPLELMRLGLDGRLLALIAVATLLVLIGAVATLRQRRSGSRSRLHSQGGDDGAASDATEEAPDAVFSAPGATVIACEAELVERRPLSEAQWDSPVPAAWTIFRIQVEGGAPLQLGLLLPVQHKEAFSAGFIERLEGDGVDITLQRLSSAIGGPVPGPAITGSSTGFLEFKTYVQNERPESIPGTLDLSEANYWIFAKLFIQDTLELYVRLNAATHKAEITGARSARGDELMRVLAATLRPEPDAGSEG